MSTISRFLRRFTLLTATLLSLIVFSPAPTLASGWSAIASTCALDENVLLKPDGRLSAKHDFTGGVFQFLPRALSEKNWRGLALPITARCMVLNPYEVTSPAWGSLIVSYQDPGEGSRIIVKLARNFRPSGVQVIATFDSNAYPATGVSMVDQVVHFDPAHMNFADSDYVVGINLYRSTLASKPRVLRVRLDE